MNSQIIKILKALADQDPYTAIRPILDKILQIKRPQDFEKLTFTDQQYQEVIDILSTDANVENIERVISKVFNIPPVKSKTKYI